MRNLIFHIFPRNIEVCQFHLKFLDTYAPQFDRIFYHVAVENGQLADAVIDILPYKDRAEVSRFANTGGESKTEFFNSMQRILTSDPYGTTFYAHSKGSSIFVGHPNYLRLENIKAWCRAMYNLNLHDVKLVENLLKYYSCAGAFKRGMGHEPHDGSSFHYSGSFYWLSNKDLTVLKLNQLSDSYYAMESFPGRVFSSDKAFCWYEYPHDLYLNKVPNDYSHWLS